MPFVVTIVTATLNRRALLERALASAGREDLTNVQHIVVDGGSTDGTLEMLSRYPNVEIISEPDRNLYDAWNKGIARATGDFIYLLNSDDEVARGALAEAGRLAALHPEADMISGAVTLTYDRGSRSERSVIIDDPRMIALREQDVGPGIPLTNGRLLRRHFINRLGGFDIRYPTAADRQFFLRAIAADAVNVTTDKLIYRYDVHRDSLTLNEKAPSVAQAEEALRMAVDGLAEAKQPRLRAGYRRWHGWAAFYLAGLEARRGNIAGAGRTIAMALMRDPIWPLRLLPLLVRHWAEKPARAGKHYRHKATPSRPLPDDRA